MQRLRRDYLASRLVQRFAPEQRLEWYVNTADYGNFAIGIDAAALVYFGKHAGELTLAESAVLAAIPEEPERNPIDAPQAARLAGEQTLRQMLEMGWVDEGQLQAAQLPEPAGGVPVRQALQAPEIAWVALEQARQRFGPAVLSRSGLRILTTTDADLQQQAECVLATHLGRLAGEPPTYVQAATDGQACLAAGLLPTLRPGDVQADHQVSGGSVVVLDPARGEILALAGNAARPELPSRALDPLVYLTALARGYTPATMLLDIPDPEDRAPPATDYRGPVRLRSALASQFAGATAYLLERIGAENVLRSARSMGMLPEAQVGAALGEVMPSLLDLARGYAVVGAEGRMVGTSTAPGAADGNGELQPSAVLAVEDPVQGTVYSYQPETRSVLSPALAYLMIDMLADDAARWAGFGRSSPLEVDRPAAVAAGSDPASADSWAVGFTPDRLVGVWMGNSDGRPMQSVDPLNGAAAVWHALTRYAHASLPRDSWPTPPEVTEVEVCDPSGMLPTVYCPTVVRELFLQGTEPTHYDMLYQPYRINRETGKLATLFTPTRLVEERVFLVPPPEAATWAESAGLEPPPTEYDTLVEVSPGQDGARITSPVPFATVNGDVTVTGEADDPALDFFRLQVGRGLNPTEWIQIGEDQASAVASGELGTWDSAGMDGLLTLQLVVVAQDGTLRTAAVPVTVDNRAPEIEILAPSDGGTIAAGEAVVFEARVKDEVGVVAVELLVDGNVVARLERPPFSTRIDRLPTGEHRLAVRAIDVAGNETTAPEISISIAP
jgi:membrane peptidoglycan carboxypeptidase